MKWDGTYDEKNVYDPMHQNLGTHRPGNELFSFGVIRLGARDFFVHSIRRISWWSTYFVGGSLLYKYFTHLRYWKYFPGKNEEKDLEIER